MSIKNAADLKQAKQLLLEQSHNYTYNNGVLKNKLNIQNNEAFRKQCAHLVAKEFINAHQEPPPKNIDVSYLKKLHQRLFCNIFDWAGKTRNESIKMSDGTIASTSTSDGKKNQALVFASNEKLENCLNELNSKLVDRNNKVSVDRNNKVSSENKTQEEKKRGLSEDITTIYALLNHARPFVQGNGVTQHLFMQKLSQAEGIKIDLAAVTPKRMEIANVEAANDNLEPMKHLFEDASNPEKAHVLKETLNGIKSKNQDKTLAEALVTTPIPGQTYTGTFESRQLDAIVIKTKNSLIVCNRHVIPRHKFKNLKIGDTITFKAQEDLNKVFIPGREIPDLTEDKVTEMAILSSSVQEQKKEVDHFAACVFGHREKISSVMERVYKNPNFSQQLSIQILHNPKSIAKLAGFQKFGIKSPKRKEAEENIFKLSEAIKDLADSLRISKEEVIKNHKEEQQRVGKTIPLPTEEVKLFLSMSSKERVNVLKTEGNPTLHRELASFLEQVNSRLSKDEHKMISNNDYASFAQSLDMPEKFAKQIMETVKQAKEMQNDIKLIKPPRQQKAMAIAS
ncbi:MAG: hypothetical protein PG977_000115 [Bartonella clarridgeiae]|nr:MAG: hypothetical protein PG977_000115 [Bartonella clarridgeiae]